MTERNNRKWSPGQLGQPAWQRLGILEWLRPGEYEHAEETLQLLRELKVESLRTGLSWADWHTPDGRKWFDWLIPTVAREVELLPCFTYTPPSLGIEPKTSSPPCNPKDYADFIDVMITDYGRHFEWLELWNEPNNLNDWDSYGIRAVVFRMSCIYGPHQFGTEDQGWVAHFLIQALQNHPLTLYGDGRQVRDILFVGDLVEAMFAAFGNMSRLAGRAFNIGGGAANSISLLELLPRIESMAGRPCRYSLADWRQGDQKYYVTDTGLFRQLTGWQPATAIDAGLLQLYEWVVMHLFDQEAARFSPVSVTKGGLPNANIR